MAQAIILDLGMENRCSDNLYVSITCPKTSIKQHGIPKNKRHTASIHLLNPGDICEVRNIGVFATTKVKIPEEATAIEPNDRYKATALFNEVSGHCASSDEIAAIKN